MKGGARNRPLLLMYISKKTCTVQHAEKGREPLKLVKGEKVEASQKTIDQLLRVDYVEAQKPGATEKKVVTASVTKESSKPKKKAKKEKESRKVSE